MPRGLLVYDIKSIWYGKGKKEGLSPEKLRRGGKGGDSMKVWKEEKGDRAWNESM